jgi:peroxiredoxin
MFRTRLASAVLLATIQLCDLTCISFGEETRYSVIGLRLENFTLSDAQGKAHSLVDFKDKKLVVLAFLGAECPLARQYATRLQELQNRYAEHGVQFLGIDANRQDSPTKIATFVRLQKLDIPVLKDLKNKLADRIRASRTPEVFLLDQDRTIRYIGGIDDQFGTGYVRRSPTQTYLASAIDELLAGKKVSRENVAAVGCRIGRVPAVDKSSPVTYCKQVAGILNKRCVSCHRSGEIAPFALTDFEDASAWAETIAEAVKDGRMPPWPADPQYGRFSNDCRLSEDEKQILYRWAAAGAPEGDRRQLPPPPAFVDGWQLPKKPDKVFYITEEPFEVPAQGPVRYQYFHVDPGFTEEMWIQGLEVRPGNRAVVHHVMVIAHPKRAHGRNFARGDQHLLSFVPGGVPLVLPPGLARRFPKNYEFLFEVHYTPNGSVQKDRSRLGVIFADLKEVTHRVSWLSASNHAFTIPPGVEHYKIEADSPPMGNGVQLLRLYPHMHLRGKQFRFEARYPDGKSDILLDILHYDFGWQLTYELAKSKPLPKGTVLHCTAYFDNSEQNLNNPDARATVRNGEQTWEEMMVGHFDVIVPVARRSAEQSKRDRKP